MRVLIIDNTIDPDSWGSPDLRHVTSRVTGTTLVVRRSPPRDLPSSPHGFDRVIVSGSKTSVLEDSPWIEELHDFVRKTLDENIPYLGVCFGHQTLARVLGGKNTCQRSKTPEIGWTRIHVTDTMPLFEGLPSTFYSFSSHFDEIASLPAPLRAVAHSDHCAIQACYLPGRPVYGIQFHPERDVSSAEHTFAAKKTENSKWFLHPKRSRDLYNSQIGERIFANFLAS
jgi:GMP synthase-like glutamine amidotransferase